MVAEPVADEVCVSLYYTAYVRDVLSGLRKIVEGAYGIDQDGDLLQNTGDEAVEGLHPVTLEEEITVDVEIAALVSVNLRT